MRTNPTNDGLAFFEGCAAAVRNTQKLDPLDFSHGVFYAYRGQVEKGNFQASVSASVAFVKGWNTALENI